MQTLKEVPHPDAIAHAIEVLRSYFDHPEADEAIEGLTLLREQAKWAHHTPQLLSEADAAADLAGVARPGAEQWVESVMHEVQVLASMWSLVGSRFDDGTCLDDFDRQKKELRDMLAAAPPQARQPVARPGAEPVAWMLPSEDGYDSAFRDRSTVAACTGNPWTGWVPLYTAPPQASQPAAQPGVEPVAWRWRASDVLPGFVMSEDPEAARVATEYGRKPQPLYTAPPQASQPERYIVPEFTGIAQRKLNSLLADGYQVTGYSIERTRDDSVRRGAVTCGGMVLWWHGDSQTVQASQPLTDEQIMAIGRELGLKCKLGGNPRIDFDYARAIEAAHGIGAAQKGKP